MSKKRTLWKTLSLTLLILLVMASTVGAAPFQSGFKPQSSRTVSELNKTWTIQFNQGLDRSTVTASNIYVTDENNLAIATSLNISSDEKSVSVVPAKNYTANKEYRLYISDALRASQTGKNLKQALVMPFTVQAAVSQDYIKTVTANYSSIVTNFIVTASTEVFTVKVNGIEMHYESANTYSLGVPNLAKGTTVTITAYDDNDNLLQTKTYQVE